MSVLKEDGTKRLIQQILASLKVGKIAIMDKALNINSKNPVENGVITQAINGLNNKIDAIIDDENESESTTFSSNKINESLNDLQESIDEELTPQIATIHRLLPKYVTRGEFDNITISIKKYETYNIKYIIFSNSSRYGMVNFTVLLNNLGSRVEVPCLDGNNFYVTATRSLDELLIITDNVSQIPSAPSSLIYQLVQGDE